MTENHWAVAYRVSGSVKAEILKGLLEAQGIQVVLSQEGIGESIYPVSVGPLSEIDILVAGEQLAEAEKILADYEAGTFEDYSSPNMEDDETSD